MKQHLNLVEMTSGVFLLALGGLVFSDRLTILNSYFGFMAGWLASVENLLL